MDTRLSDGNGNVIHSHFLLLTVNLLFPYCICKPECNIPGVWVANVFIIFSLAFEIKILIFETVDYFETGVHLVLHPVHQHAPVNASVTTGMEFASPNVTFLECKSYKTYICIVLKLHSILFFPGVHHALRNAPVVACSSSGMANANLSATFQSKSYAKNWFRWFSHI